MSKKSRAHAQRESDDYYFGACPVCHKCDGYANAGRSHRFYCLEHRMSWYVGANLFDSWKDQTEAEQRLIWNKIGLDDFQDVTANIDDERMVSGRDEGVPF